MNEVKFLPAINDIDNLSDVICRAAWHLNLLKNYEFIIYTNEDLELANIRKPQGFTDEVNNNLCSFLEKVRLVKIDSHYSKDLLEGASAVLKWKENDIVVNDFLKKECSCTIYRVDSNIVRQEGSFYIQCAFDLLLDKTKLTEKSKLKFNSLYESLGKFKESWILATGPSVDEYQKYDFDNNLTIACNSTILDDSLMEKCKPKIVVFADPIFHFGVSQYAGEFRRIVKNRLETTDITIILPFKYYALFVSIFPEYESRIIGVPLDKDIDFNTDISHSFSVKSTANILTLLLIPVASTFSNSTNILGCDGRSFDNDDYFWGHGKTVQINSKMQNIQDVHPGFFKIDYNEYYFEHCHTLECLMQCGEKLGKTFIHHADSFIPALRDRNPSYRLESKCVDQHCLLIEPDGIGTAGHYVPWYNQVISELDKRDNKVTVFCNKKQDTSLYKSKAMQVFTSHSWGISRGEWCFKKGFEQHQSFKKFFDELNEAIQSYCIEKNIQEIKLFMYYGSVQILYGLHEVRKELKKKKIRLDISMCLFHESVILNAAIKKPRFPPNARQILLEGLAQKDSYNIAAVTCRLKDFIYDKLEVKTVVMPNPIPSGYNNTIELTENIKPNKKFRVVFPCALREEKGSVWVEQLMKDIVSSKVDAAEYEFFVRKFDKDAMIMAQNIITIDEAMTDLEYQQLLKSADVIVIPYLAPQFTFRTSGIIVDAMRAQKPIVAIEGTWLGDVVKHYFSGLSIKPFSSLSFLSAFSVIKKNSLIFEKHSKVSFENYDKENSWSKLIEVMLDT